MNPLWNWGNNTLKKSTLYQVDEGTPSTKKKEGGKGRENPTSILLGTTDREREPIESET